MTKTEITEIYRAQKGLCFYCGKPMGPARGDGPENFNLDHFVPRCRGGKLNGNAVASHPLCNVLKGDRLPSKSERVRFREPYRRIEEHRAGVKAYRAGMAA